MYAHSVNLLCRAVGNPGFERELETVTFFKAGMLGSVQGFRGPPAGSARSRSTKTVRLLGLSDVRGMPIAHR